MNKLYKEESIQAIGNAIREKGGTTSLLKVEEMAQAIADIPEPTGTEEITQNGTYNVSMTKYVAVNVEGGGIEPSGTLTITQNGTYNIRNYDQVIVNVESTPVRPVVPQTGTWQLRQTTDKKYVILGTDDDVQGNAKYARMLRTFGFPYTMNVEAEFLNRDLTSDNDFNIFTSTDAPSQFPNGTTVTDLGKYLLSSGTGEVAQHGSSSKTLWNSNLLTGNTLTSIYNTYVYDGGTKNIEEFKTAVMNAGKDSDIAQGATYVADSRASIETAIDDFVYTVGIWGGDPTVTIDGIEVSLLPVRNYSYPWRTNHYTGASTSLSMYRDNTSPYDITRNSSNLGALSVIDNVSVGHVVELFIHNTSDLNYTQLRTDLTTLKNMVDSGTVQVVTRKQYASLGEYVDNPVTSIAVTRTSTTINVGEPDSANAYTVTATFSDNTTADVTSRAIVKIIDDTTEAKIVQVPAYYKGFTATVQVEVQSGSSSILEPIILQGKKISTTGTVSGGSGDVYVYDCNNLDAIYFTSSKNQQYLIGWSDELLDTGTLSFFTKPYYRPNENPTEISVPEGMRYYYVNSSTTSGFNVYPWSISSIPTT